MEITASLVKELRERTGAGMMECKKALSENAGNIDAAAEALRRIRTEPGLAQRLSEAGRKRVIERLSPQAWLATMPDGVQRAALKAAATAAARRGDLSRSASRA